MHASVRFYGDGPLFEAATRRIEVGMIPIWQRMPGFHAAYGLRCANRFGLGIVMFDSAETLAAANATAAAWGTAHLADLTAELNLSDLFLCQTLLAVTAAERPALADTVQRVLDRAG
jgi:hypothetical protein